MNWTAKSVTRAAVWTACVLALVWLGATAAIFRVMHQPPEQFGQVMAHMPGPLPFMVLPFETLWMRARAGTLRVGDPAPDFSLTRLDRSANVQLSSATAQGRPVVLIFGSYT